MNYSMKTHLIHMLPALFIALLLISMLSGCYTPQDAAPGKVSLSVVSGARSLTTANGTDDVWVVGIVIDGSFADKLKELQHQEDIRKSTKGSVNAVKDIWIDLAMKSAIRFEGGRPFFQFRMPRINAEATMPAEGSFIIQGIPANKEYFLDLIVVENQISTIDDITGDPLASSPVHYFDPANIPATGYAFTTSSGSGIYSYTGTPLPAGWYSFTKWTSTFNKEDKTWTGLGGIIWTDAAGIPIPSQPFTVASGGNAQVRTLITDW